MLTLGGEEVVMHYTTVAGALSIIKNSELWASDIGFMNDSQEGWHGIDAIHKAIDCALALRRPWVYSAESGGQESKGPGFDLLFLKQELKEGEPIVNDFGRIIDFTDESLRPPSSHYSVSFCSQGDLLSQWRGYGDSSGIAIGFSKEQLVEYCCPCKSASFVQVKYGNAIVEDFKRRIVAAIDAGRDLRDLMSELQRESIFYKDSSFKEECETRLILTGDRKVEFRERNGSLIPFVKLSFDKSWIASAIVGPGRNQDLNRESLKRAFDANGYKGVEVTGSSIPLR